MRNIERESTSYKALEIFINAASLLLMVNPGHIVDLLKNSIRVNRSADGIAQTLRGNNRQKAALNAIAPKISEGRVSGAVQKSLDFADTYGHGVTNKTDLFLSGLDDYCE